MDLNIDTDRQRICLKHFNVMHLIYAYSYSDCNVAIFSCEQDCIIIESGRDANEWYEIESVTLKEWLLKATVHSLPYSIQAMLMIPFYNPIIWDTIKTKGVLKE